MPVVRKAELGDLRRLAQIWRDAWVAANGDLVPGLVVRLRGEEYYHNRLHDYGIEKIRVFGFPFAPRGFCVVDKEELAELFVEPESQGQGIGDKLRRDGEQRLRDDGVEIAWSYVVLGNHPVKAYYEKRGWHQAGFFEHKVSGRLGTARFKSWRMEKRLTD